MTTMRRLSLAASLLVACGGAPAVPTAAAPSTLEIDAAPNGLWWDGPSRTLYIADDAGSRILAWQDGGAPPRAFAIPAEGRPGLGQVIRLADGTLVVPRHGHGETGAIVAVTPDGTARPVPGIAVEPRRVGLAAGPEGRVFSTRFGRNPDGSKVGEITEVTLAGGERALAGGLEKPIGVAVAGDWIYVSDQDGNRLVRCRLASCDGFETVAELAAPDLVAAGPAGAVLVASKGGAVTLVCPDGAARVVSGGAPSRGVAYDPAGQRLFVAEHGHEGRGVVRIVPLAPDACAR
jgi:sugar lactone lactonase YvrE